VSRIDVTITRVRGRQDGDLPLPRFATRGSAGADLCAAVEKDLVIAPGHRVLIPTGFAVAIPDGYEGQIRPRSGLAMRHGITLPNSPGTIDSDYRGELQVILQNLGEAPFVVRRGDRIAQLVISPVVRPSFLEVDGSEGLGETERGGGGFGHTGC
jgi:dUTP pyrophosphatase